MTPECAIPMCGVEEEDGEILLPICSNGHHMHSFCMQRLMASTYPKAMSCPMCREESLCRMAYTTLPKTTAMMCTPFSSLASVIAVRIGAKELLAQLQQHDAREEGGDRRVAQAMV